MPKIELIVTDVDGCLTHERSVPFNLILLGKIRDLNQQARKNDNLPEITLCTGRPQPYVEALMKIIDCRLPAICENGGMIFDMHTNSFQRVSGLDAVVNNRLNRMKQMLQTEMIPRFPVEIQPGKETHHTLVARDHREIEAATSYLTTHYTAELADFTLTMTENCLNIVPDFFDKGTAFLELTKQLKLDPARIAAVGDTPADLPFMKLAGYPMCPGNAAEPVKKISGYTAVKEYTEGLLEIIEKCREINATG